MIGVVECGGKVKAKAVPKDKMKGKNLRAFVRQSVNTTDVHLMTDEYKGYIGMNRIVPHSVIRHSVQYVDGDIHTNSIESFWALLKRGMFGQFHSVSKRHLQRYVDEFCYRFNARDNDATDTFHSTISLGLGVKA